MGSPKQNEFVYQPGAFGGGVGENGAALPAP
jgi:hypothetical protein